MHTFFGTLLGDHRRRSRRRPSTARPSQSAVPPAAKAPSCTGLGSEDGFLLIEVIISALLVALIAFATFSGFDVVNRLSADQRHHNQAALLAAQSQEQLRSDPATTLDALESTPHVYTRTVGGTVYTITQEANPVSGSGSSTGCNANEKSANSGANIQITSTVTWPQLGSKRPPVRQSSLITPPTGSALEVDVTGGGTPPAPIAGITATAKFTPVEAGTATYAQGTTGSTGCVVLTGLATTSATVEITQKTNFVTPNGTLVWPNKELTIAPNITTHYEVRYAEGGRITAEYTYKGATTWEGKEVRSDTFTVFNTNIPEEPQFVVGSTAFSYGAGGEEKYTPLTTTYAKTATTPTATKYSNGDLFPFSGWSASAGDCHSNSTVSKEAVSESANVESGKATAVKVPLSYVLLNVYNGTQSKPGSLEKVAYPVTITDSQCESSKTANNAAAVNLAHTQSTSTEGHLEVPFQPFGKAALCVYNPTAKKTYRVSYSNSTATGSAANIYIGEGSAAEKVAQRTAEEAAARTKREGEELVAREKRESEEAPARIAREKEEAKEKETKEQEAATKLAKEKEETASRETAEKEEAAAKAKWVKERAEGKITKAQLETKEKEQTKARETREKTEATTKANREKEEATARAKREAEEKTTEEKRKKEETTRKAAEASEATAKSTAEASEAAAKVAAEAAEAAEAKTKEVAVASGQSKC